MILPNRPTKRLLAIRGTGTFIMISCLNELNEMNRIPIVKNDMQMTSIFSRLFKFLSNGSINREFHPPKALKLHIP